MDEIIQKIIDIDQKACSIVNEAEDEKKNLDGIIAREINSIKKDIEARAKNKSEALKQLEDNEAEEKIHNIEEQKNQALKKIEALYKDNVDRWVDDVVNEIINS